MRAVLLSVLLCSCTNWTDLECRVRMACGDDGGSADAGSDDDGGGVVPGPLAFEVVQSFHMLPIGSIVGLARGTTHWALAANDGWCWEAPQICMVDNVAAIDAAGSPSRFWIVSPGVGGTATSFSEADGGTVYSYTGDVPFPAQTLAAYDEVNGGIAAAVFGASSPGDGGRPLTEIGFSDTQFPPGSVPCELLDALDSAAIDSLTVAVAVGATTNCAAVADGGTFSGYAVAFFPSGPMANTVVALQPEATPGRVRVGSNGNTGAVVMETGDGIAAATLRNLRVEQAAAFALHIEGAGASPRGFLDDVEQTFTEDRFVLSLTNPTHSTVRILDADRSSAFVLPPGSTAIVLLGWNGGSIQFESAGTLPTGAPGDIHLDADPGNIDVWLAASCTADAGVLLPCNGGTADKYVLRLMF
jgi:hypothetical protein